MFLDFYINLIIVINYKFNLIIFYINLSLPTIYLLRKGGGDILEKSYLMQNEWLP